MTTTELLAALAAAQTGEPAQSVESAIAVYLGAKARMDAYSAVADAAKELIEDVMAETGQTAYVTAAGKAASTADSTAISYDAKALDALAASDDGIARLLSPHRKVTKRTGALRITAAK